MPVESRKEIVHEAQRPQVVDGLGEYRDVLAEGARLAAQFLDLVGESADHVGCGLGYYTAVMAHCVGPTGHVLAYEVDEMLASGATENLSRMPWADVRRLTAEPSGLWRSPPFEPSLRQGALFGRGASDDKGQLFAHLKAVELLAREHGGLPGERSHL